MRLVRTKILYPNLVNLHIAAVYAILLGRVFGSPFRMVSIKSRASFHLPPAPQQLMAAE